MDKTSDYQDLTVEVRHLSTLAWNLYKEGDIDASVYNNCVAEADDRIDELTMRIESMLHRALSKKKKLSAMARKIIDELTQ